MGWRRRLVRAASVALVLLTAAGCHHDGADRSTPTTAPAASTTTAEPVVPQELPDGFRVLDRTTLLAPTFVDDHYDTGRDSGTAWTAILSVPDAPQETWRRYVDQVLDRLGRDPSRTPAPGCGRDDRPGVMPMCEIWLGGSLASGRGANVSVYLTLTDEPDDVARRYVLTISLRPDIGGGDGGGPGRRAGDPLPAPHAPRRDVRVGEPLAPSSTAYPDDDHRYVLLPGSELVAVYGPGSLTGGFSVLLHVPRGSVDEVAADYAEQGDQHVSPTDRTRVLPTTHGGTIWKVRYPSGGAGGYSATIRSVDPPGPGGWIAYELAND